MTPEEQKKALRKLKAELTRRKNHRGNPVKYRCIGGPFDGDEIFLQTKSSMTFSIGKLIGYYIETQEPRYHHQQRYYSPAVSWIQS